MSVNLSNNPEYIAQANNFGGGNITPEDVTPAQVEILKSMDLPTNGGEALRYAPYFISAYAGSKLLSEAAVKGASLNPLKHGLENITVADSFNNSKIGRAAQKIDNYIYPLAQKYSGQIHSVKSTISRFTPNWVKNLIEKIKIGVTPLNRMALDQYKGMTARAAEQSVNTLKALAPEKLSQLGLTDIIRQFATKQINASEAIIQISEKLKNMPAKNVIDIVGKKSHILEELNTAKAFIGTNVKSTTAKGLQRGLMAVSEAAGGGVIGNSIFGILMNSIFLASTIKRTWNAPWGEKLSTFMEGALVDFCGGYLMALLGTRITYKLLGIKNADKTAAELTDIKNLTKDIKTQKLGYKKISKLLNIAKYSSLTEENINEAISMGLKANASPQEIIEFLTNKKLTSANAINTAIDNLSDLRKLQNRGFFKNLINRPLRWIGNFFSVGLENLPAKVNDGKLLTPAKIALRNLTNGFKFVAGYPIRFLLVLMIVTPPLTKLCAKISHTVFGKPTKSIMDEREGKTENKDKQNAKIDMNTFSEYTKATGMAKTMQQKTTLSKTIDGTGKISDSFLNSALNIQKDKAERLTNNISPATYIPSSTPSDFTNPEAKAIVAKYSYSADMLNSQIKKELIDMKKNQC